MNGRYDDFSDPLRDQPKITKETHGTASFQIQTSGPYGFFKVTQEKSKVQPITGMFTSLDDAKKAIRSYLATVKE